eukprot:NODE_83_length_22684_cov_0.307934.p6 type:complete len:260 gc:universal NODE_83_length_22684_cov_0.307934:5159-5938(+)
MLNIFRTFVLISLSGFLFYYFSPSDSSISRRAPTNFISQCSTLVPNMVALTILDIGPHLNDWLAALSIQQVKVTFMLDRAGLGNAELVNQIFNAGHNIGIDARSEALTTSNIVSTLKELSNIVGPIIKKAPRFYTLSDNNAEQLASVALQAGLYAVKLNTGFLKTGDIVAQVANVQLVGDQTIIGMVDSTASLINTNQFSGFLATLRNSKNNLVSLADCTQKTSAYDLWFPNEKSTAAPTEKSGETKFSAGSVNKWLWW